MVFRSCWRSLVHLSVWPVGPEQKEFQTLLTGRADQVLPLHTSTLLYNSTYVKTTMPMLTILREVEEWTRLQLREACLLLFASAITKSSLYARQNNKAHAHQLTLLSLAP